MKEVAIIGAGSWGTALAALWGRDGRAVSLWGHDPERVARIRAVGENERYLPGVHLPAGLHVTSDLGDCISAEVIVLVTPSVALRQIAERLRQAGVKEETILLSCTKGLEHDSGLRMSEVLAQVFPHATVSALSGPNLAVEVARGLPTATVIGCANEACATELQATLGSERFRIYTSSDVTSIELGGALKNVFAIPAGVSDGIGLGDNSKAALVTRALAELVRLGSALGGNPRTFYGLSGAGDLIATCFSKHSRNRSFGERLGRGQPPAQIQAEMQMVVEGIPTTASAFACARRAGVETPIIDQVHAVLYGKASLREAMAQLLGRDPKAEQF